MDNATHKALKESIRHWEKNAAIEQHQFPHDVKMGVQHCKLCRLFYTTMCMGCPVKVRTGRFRCIGSPYSKVISAYLSEQYTLFHKRALEEVEFLKSLLPEKGTTDG